jgi:GAF domain-containing protein
LEEVQAIQQRYLAQTWKDFLITRPVIQVDYTQPGIELGNGSLLHRARREAMVHGQTVTVEAFPPDQDESAASPQTPATGSGQAALVVPLKLREQVIGTMTLHETSHQRPWMPEEIDMAETIAEQVVLTVENLRLMDETQRRVAREQLVGEISDRMQQAMDMEDLMRITAEELNMALGGSRTFVQMGTAAELVGGDGSGHKSEEER